MATLAPLDQPCPHLATPAEHDRDPGYTACYARPEEPCRWARRYDGLADPLFHATRIERAYEIAPPQTPEDAEAFRAAVLQSGLV